MRDMTASKEAASKVRRKPVAVLSDKDGNIYVLTAVASISLREAGMSDDVERLQSEVSAAQSYDAALMTIMRYVDVR
jgi:hypothetical protein